MTAPQRPASNSDARKRTEDARTPEDAATFIRALVNAWDCCATCAGGVLAKRDRARDAGRAS